MPLPQQQAKRAFLPVLWGDPYQIVGTTMRGLVKEMGLDPNETKFTPEVQDAMAAWLMQRRGMGKHGRGEIGTDRLMDNLAHGWASLPKAAGGGAYAGQHASVSRGMVEDALGGKSPVRMERRGERVDPRLAAQDGRSGPGTTNALGPRPPPGGGNR